MGKSTVVERFAQENYKDYLLIDFSLEGKDLPAGDALIVFDEVQRFPIARQAIKALVKDGRYHYIETASLISIRKNVKDIFLPSEEEQIKMFPMDFEEHLWAMGDEVTAPAIREAFASRKALPESVHQRIVRDYRTYLAVGGMPQAVAALVQGEDFSKIDRVKRTILSLYEEDLEKHDDEDGDRAGAVFDTIPSQLSHHNARFHYAAVADDARARGLLGVLDFLGRPMMVNVCRNVSAPEVSLGLYADAGNFKMYLGDTGLLVTQIMLADPGVGDSLYRALIAGKLGVNEGMVVENAVAQALAANEHGLFFHEYGYQPEGADKTNRYEVDFLLVRGKRLCPVEVKSSGYKSHKSFDYFTEKYDVKVNERFIVYTKNLAHEGNLTYVPLYMAMYL